MIRGLFVAAALTRPRFPSGSGGGGGGDPWAGGVGGGGGGAALGRGGVAARPTDAAFYLEGVRMHGLFVAAALIGLLLGGAAQAAAQAVSLTGSDATVQPGSSSPVRINQPFGSSNWVAKANQSGTGTVWTGNSVQIPGASPARWFCWADINSNRSWGVRTRTADYAAADCPTNGLGSVSTSGLVVVIVEDSPSPSVVVQFPLNASYWTTQYGYTRSGSQTAVTASQLTVANARTADRVLLVHTSASGGTLCVTGSESGCSTALTWIPNAAASTTVTAAGATAAGFTAGWSGGWSGTSAGSFYLFVSAVASGLTVDVSSGATTVTGGTHAVTGLTANTRHVATVCSRLGTGGAGELCYDASADTGIQGVEVMTQIAATAPTSVTTGGVTTSGFTVGWSGAVSGVSDGSYRLFVEQASSGLDVDLSSETTVTGASHAVTGLTAGTRYVVTVCSPTTVTLLCHDTSADTGIQGVAVTTRSPTPADDPEPDPDPTGAPSRVEGVTTEALNGGLRVRWSPAGGAVSQYRVDVLAPPASGSARGVTEDGWTLVGRVYTDADTTEAVVAGLTNGVGYRVTVTALGSESGVEGPASEPETATPVATGEPAGPSGPAGPDPVPALPFGAAAALAATLAALARRKRAGR